VQIIEEIYFGEDNISSNHNILAGLKAVRINAVIRAKESKLKKVKEK
jgi:hypothetical protein